MDCGSDEGVLRIGETVYGVNAGSPEARYGDEVYAREGTSEKREAEQQGHMGDEAVMAAFEANKNDAARVSGN